MVKKKYKQQDISSGIIICVKCNEPKGLSDYYDKSYKCKGCIKKEYREKVSNKPPTIKEIKYCGVCNVNIVKRKNECRNCKDKRVRGEKRSNKVLIKEVVVDKVCSKCGVNKPIEGFNYYNKKKGTYKSHCKVCDSIHHKKWREDGGDRVKGLMKKSNEKYEKKIRENNRIIREGKRIEKERLLREKEERKKQREHNKLVKEQRSIEYKKLMEYYKTDEWKEIKKEKERVRQYNKWKRKWNENELFAIKVRLRNLIRNSFRRTGYKKFNDSTKDIIGISYEEFKIYLESKFIDGMNWDNRGEWHIDHIIPLSTANNKDELRELCHYTNLQPLWAEDNIKKSNKIL